MLCEPEKSHRRSDNRLKIAFSVGFTSSGLNRHDGSFFIGSPGVITEVVIIIVPDWQTGCCLRKYCSAEKEFSIFVCFQNLTIPVNGFIVAHVYILTRFTSSLPKTDTRNWKLGEAARRFFTEGRTIVIHYQRVSIEDLLWPDQGQ